VVVVMEVAIKVVVVLAAVMVAAVAMVEVRNAKEMKKPQRRVQPCRDLQMVGHLSYEHTVQNAFTWCAAMVQLARLTKLKPFVIQASGDVSFSVAH
jgi:hypothetical protein